MTGSPLENVLPRLLEKTMEVGKRAVVMVGSEERVAALDALLWTYSQDSWLPHGTAKDGDPDDQPVWLTSKDENPNGSQFMFLADGASSDRLDGFERCFELFDGNDSNAMTDARRRWKEYKEADHALTYWQQTGNGWQEGG